MNENQIGQEKIQIEETKDESIIGTITLSFEFLRGVAQYVLEDCCIRHVNTQDEEEEEQNHQMYFLPNDVNIEYCYSIQTQEEIKFDVKAYLLSDISDLSNKIQYQDKGYSQFYVSWLSISPCEQYLIVNLHVQILGKQETDRLIIVDLNNQKIKKIFLRSYYIKLTQFNYSQDGNLAIINIGKDCYTKFILLNLKNGIQDANIIQFDDLKISQMDYDSKTGCLFFASLVEGQICQIPLDYSNLTIDKSKMKIYEFNWRISDISSYYFIQLVIIGDFLALIVNDCGELAIARIGKHPKIIKHQQNFNYIPQFIYKTAFVVMSDYDQQEFLFINLSSGKLIRQKKRQVYIEEVMVCFYPSKQSFFISIVNSKRLNWPNTDNPFDDDQIQEEWISFDLIQGTQKRLEIQQLTDKKIAKHLFTHNLIVQQYDNKIVYKKKLS